MLSDACHDFLHGELDLSEFHALVSDCHRRDRGLYNRDETEALLALIHKGPAEALRALAEAVQRCHDVSPLAAEEAGLTARMDELIRQAL